MEARARKPKIGNWGIFTWFQSSLSHDYEDAGEEAQINHAIIATEKLEAVNEVLQVLESKKHKDLQLEKWFTQDYFVNPLKVEIQHFIGIESPVLHYIPEFVSDKNSVIQIQGNHENVLEIDSNLIILTKTIRHGKK